MDAWTVPVRPCFPRGRGKPHAGRVCSPIVGEPVHPWFITIVVTPRYAQKVSCAPAYSGGKFDIAKMRGIFIPVEKNNICHMPILFSGSCPHCNQYGSFEKTSDGQDLISYAGAMLSLVVNRKDVYDEMLNGESPAGIPGCCPNCGKVVFKCPNCATLNRRPLLRTNCDGCGKMFSTSY